MSQLGNKLIYDPVEMTKRATDIVINLETNKDMDPGMKVAVLKLAASVYENAIAAQGMAVVLNNIINGAGK